MVYSANIPQCVFELGVEDGVRVDLCPRGRRIKRHAATRALGVHDIRY